jgi:hypothetical protein
LTGPGLDGAARGYGKVGLRQWLARDYALPYQTLGVKQPAGAVVPRSVVFAKPWPARRLDASGAVAELALLSKSPQR